MPWFYCDDCGDTIKKPKVAAHCHSCSASAFTCIDCSLQFDQRTVHAHIKCVTEHEKYAQGATKPGGYAAAGYTGGGASAATSGQGNPQDGPVGLEFLSQRPPWKCNICNVTCTSQDTLTSHATGSKHKRRVKAALSAKQGSEAAQHRVKDEQEQEGKPAEQSNKENMTNGQASTANNGTEIGKTSRSEKSKQKNWKKIAKSELKRHGGQLKLKKLIAALGLSADDGDEVLRKLRKSNKFEIEGKCIKLR